MAVAALLPVQASEGIEPAVRLREYLQHARAEGRTFDDAWPFARVAATRELPREGKNNPHKEWIAIFDSARHIWQAAYERQELAWIDTLLNALNDG